MKGIILLYLYTEHKYRYTILYQMEKPCFSSPIISAFSAIKAIKQIADGFSIQITDQSYRIRQQTQTSCYLETYEVNYMNSIAK